MWDRRGGGGLTAWTPGSSHRRTTAGAVSGGSCTNRTGLWRAAVTHQWVTEDDQEFFLCRPDLSEAHFGPAEAHREKRA